MHTARRQVNDFDQMMSLISAPPPNASARFEFTRRDDFEYAFRELGDFYSFNARHIRDVLAHEEAHAAACRRLGLNHFYFIELGFNSQQRLNCVTPGVTHVHQGAQLNKKQLEQSIQVCMAPRVPSERDWYTAEVLRAKLAEAVLDEELKRYEESRSDG